MTRKALGRGISALLSDSAATRQEENQLEIDIDLIEPNPAQPRSHFDETHAPVYDSISRMLFV